MLHIRAVEHFLQGGRLELYFSVAKVRFLRRLELAGNARAPSPTLRGENYLLPIPRGYQLRNEVTASDRGVEEWDFGRIAFNAQPLPAKAHVKEVCV